MPVSSGFRCGTVHLASFPEPEQDNRGDGYCNDTSDHHGYGRLHVQHGDAQQDYNQHPFEYRSRRPERARIPMVVLRAMYHR
jgi:hypothetical protein